MKNALRILIIFNFMFFYKAGIAQVNSGYDIFYLYPSADNSIFSSPENMHSAALGNFLYCGKAGATNYRRILIKFDLSSIPSYATIIESSLILHNTNPDSISNFADTIKIYRLTSDWGEASSMPIDLDENGVPATNGDATWDCNFATDSTSCFSAWNNAGGDFIDTVSSRLCVSDTFGVAESAPYTSRMNDDINGWIHGSFPNYGWILIADESQNELLQFHSKQINDSSFMPQLYVNYYDSALAISLISFDGNFTNDGKVFLQWKTASELNCNYFEIERSIDGKYFFPIGRMEGHGTTSQDNNYSFEDVNPNSKLNYYRIKDVEFNHLSHYSKIIAVETEMKNSQISLTNNIVNNYLEFRNPLIFAGNNFEIFEPNSKIVRKGIVSSSKIDVSTLPSGIYFIRIVVNHIIYNTQFVKQ